MLDSFRGSINRSLWWKLGVVVIMLISVVNLCFLEKTVKYHEAKRKFCDQLLNAILANREAIDVYYREFHEYPILEDGNIHFWDIRCNQYIWHCQFKGLTNIATNPIAEEERRSAVRNVWIADKNKVVEENEETRKYLLNPYSKSFDWLAEDADGNLYSPEMPREALLASPPIRIVNIRSPQNASDPPFYEDFTNGIIFEKLPGK